MYIYIYIFNVYVYIYILHGSVLLILLLCYKSDGVKKPDDTIFKLKILLKLIDKKFHNNEKTKNISTTWK